MVRSSPAFDRYDLAASKNDVSKILDFILFTDDTNIFFSHKKKVEKTLNEELLKLTTSC